MNENKLKRSKARQLFGNNSNNYNKKNPVDCFHDAFIFSLLLGYQTVF